MGLQVLKTYMAIQPCVRFGRDKEVFGVLSWIETTIWLPGSEG